MRPFWCALLLVFSTTTMAHAQSSGPLVLVGAGLSAAAVFDLETTFAGLERGGVERNPLMRPFVNAGRVPAYLVRGATVAGILWGTDYLRDRDRWWWWMPATAVTAGWTAVALHNLHEPMSVLTIQIQIH